MTSKKSVRSEKEVPSRFASVGSYPISDIPKGRKLPSENCTGEKTKNKDEKTDKYTHALELRIISQNRMIILMLLFLLALLCIMVVIAAGVFYWMDIYDIPSRLINIAKG
jgi:hypothetical protein